MIQRIVRGVGLVLLLGWAGIGLCDEIRLPNRTLDPAPGIEPALRDRLGDAAQTAAVEAVVQLPSRPPTPQDRKLLQAAGVELGPYVGGGAFIARIRAGSNPHTIPGLRWAGLVLPQDKISRDLWSLAVQDPGGTGTLRVAVHFHSGLAPDAMDAVATKFPGGEQTYGTMSVRALRIPRSALEPLAMEPSVRWLEEISSESFPLPAAP